MGKYIAGVKAAETISEKTGIPHTTYSCERCGRGTVVKTHYCPNCGAKMDGGDNDAVD